MQGRKLGSSMFCCRARDGTGIGLGKAEGEVTICNYHVCSLAQSGLWVPQGVPAGVVEGRGGKKQ